jgi:hypothetical protein
MLLYFRDRMPKRTDRSAIELVIITIEFRNCGGVLKLLSSVENVADKRLKNDKLIIIIQKKKWICNGGRQ